jgi:uncharacterized membrane protein YkvA (DUF1232 family)
VQLLIGIGTAIAAVWLLVAIALIRAKRRGANARALLRLVPELARLLTRLARDRMIPLRVRARIYLAIAYNIQPINLIPDFIPVIGLLDNVVITSWAIRSTVKHAGPDTVERHWPGSPEGLTTVNRVLHLTPPTTPVTMPPPPAAAHTTPHAAVQPPIPAAASDATAAGP